MSTFAVFLSFSFCFIFIYSQNYTPVVLYEENFSLYLYILIHDKLFMYTHWNMKKKKMICNMKKKWKQKEIWIKGSPNHVAPLPPKKSSKSVISSSSRASSASWEPLLVPLLAPLLAPLLPGPQANLQAMRPLP